MKNLLFILPSTILLLAGCQTYQPQTSRARTTQDQLIQQENQRRMAGRIETLELEIDRISRELDNLRRNFEVRSAAIEQKSEADKQELINRLTAQLEKLLAQKPTPAPATPTSTGGNVTGYEHVVRQGETLSTIAKAYNVTTKAIINANQIKNPDRLSIGQKLFIPE
jgi:LysM repeat protein